MIVNKKKIIAVLLALLMVLSTAACAPKSRTSEKDGTKVSETTSAEQPSVNEPSDSRKISDVEHPERYGGVLDLVWMECNDTLDPMYSTGWASYYWSMYVYENPLARDVDGVIRPNVCEYELSDDGMTLKLWVRDGMTFHDGSPVEVEDVVASLDRAGKMVKNVQTYFTEKIADCVIEGNTVTYTFKEYSPRTIYYISADQNWCGIMPKEICEKYPDSPINKVEDAIGTGPYYVESYESNVCYHLKRYDGYKPINADYSGMAGPKMAYFDAINVWINFDNTSVSMAVLNGDYDTYTINREYFDVAAEKGLVQWKDPQYNIMGLFINTKGNRPVNDVNLRKAIVAALDFQQVIDMEFPSYTMNSNPMLGAVFATDVFESADWYGKSNPELAKQYLAKSSYKGEELVILVDKNNIILCQPLMESQLEAVGINCRLEYMDSNAAKEFYSNPMNEFDMFLQCYVANSFSPMVLSATVKSTFWDSEKKDELFAALETTIPGSEECAELWKELAQLWVDEAAVINIGTVTYEWTKPDDLVINMEGNTWRYFWNCYWEDPSKHMD